MEPRVTSEYTDIATTVRLDTSGNGLLGPLMERLGQTDVTGFFSLDNILDLLNSIWLIYTILAYLFCIFLLVLYVYASTRKHQLEVLQGDIQEKKERIYEEHFKSGPKNNRIQDVMTHIGSDSPSDWKLAIIEADIILDEILKNAGYAGNSLGERLKSIAPSQLQSLDDAWQAHKVRNQVAHAGADFILTRKLAEDTIKQYRRVFYEFGIQ
jgi:hypothetical protein